MYLTCYHVIELLQARYCQEVLHGHAVLNEQLHKTDTVHQQSVQHGMLQGPHLKHTTTALH